MKMVGCWNLGLEMIPNDRPRSSLGSPGGFGPKIPIFGLPGGPGSLDRRGISAFLRMWPRRNGWAPYVGSTAGPKASQEPAPTGGNKTTLS